MIIRFPLLVPALLCSIHPAIADTIHVDASISPSGDGGSWESAFGNLSDALDVAVSGDTILVAAGEYLPGPSGPSFKVNPGVTVLGGHPKGGGERDPGTHSTVLQGSGRILLVVGGSAPVVLDGLRFEGGEAVVSSNLQPAGAAIAAFDGGQLEIRNCQFANNLAWDQGSGFSRSPLGGDIYYHHSGGTYADILTIGSCTFSGSLSPDVDAYGGAIYASVPQATLTDCEFTGYRALNAGAIYLLMDGSGGGAVFSRCRFKGNEARFDGGAMIIEGGAQAVNFYNCLFSGNHSGDYGIPDADGGAIRLGKPGPTTFMNCTFAGNSAGGDYNQLAGRGGAIAVNGGAGQTIQFLHNLFAGNFETAGLGPYVNAVNFPAGYMGSATFAGNHTSEEELPDSIPAVPNHTPFSAVWSPPEFRTPITLQTSQLGGATRFLATTAGDLGMDYPSPLADLAAEGVTSHATLYLPAGRNEFDAAGQARSQGWVPDPGCFEAQPAPGTVEVVGFEVDTTSQTSRLAFVSDVPVRVQRSYDLNFWSSTPVRTISPYSRNESLQLQFGESTFYRVERAP
ncbi:right-handed parallel beta-helix repeat-containing protein [Luteolibacter marinus]|uniref:right-handed parallel beta-helix repeat-containing protein n=1 Tax=Luteolibacter marinus TaxID=2776705 RepID=UPI001866E4B6|nr:right-handed parallel beta-helix repeat-containing protein [Luteolibacter marinus]